MSYTMICFPNLLCINRNVGYYTSLGITTPFITTEGVLNFALMLVIVLPTEYLIIQTGIRSMDRSDAHGKVSYFNGGCVDFEMKERGFYSLLRKAVASHSHVIQ